MYLHIYYCIFIVMHIYYYDILFFYVIPFIRFIIIIIIKFNKHANFLRVQIHQVFKESKIQRN